MEPDGSQAEARDAAVHRSSRDPDALRARLEPWLGERLGASAVIGQLRATDTNGMSSETMLFDVDRGGASDRLDLVARIAPEVTDVPVFPSYNLGQQFRAIERVGERSTVPVPKVWWFEDDPAVLGTPFFVMTRVDGSVPPDVMPYNFGGNWLFDADPDDQRRLQDSSVDVLARLHAIADPEHEFDFLADAARTGSPLRRKVDRTRDWYEWVIGGRVSDAQARVPVLDEAFAWLEAHWPAEEGPTVLAWGDSRIGNVLYRDFEPVAVLDWEMACLCPRELDVAWMVYAHDVFEDIAADLGMPGMAEFLRLDDVVATYEAASGARLADLQFFTVLAAIQYAIVFLRTGQRAVHFGEREAPAHPEELLMNRRGLERTMTDDWNARSRS